VFHTLGALEVNVTENLIDLLPGNVFVVDKQGYLLWGNQRILDTLGLKKIDDYVGKHIGYWDNYSWKCCQTIIELGEEIVGEESYNGRYYVTSRKPLFSTNSEIVGILGTALDTTVQKQAEIAKQEFLMNMAHDLRTPLAGIIGLSSIQADSKMEPQEQQEYGQMIQGASEQLLELLNSVIEVTATEHQVEQLKKEPINLSQLSDELQTLMQPSLQSKGLQFQVKVDSILPVIISDRIKLKRLLLNILSNAVKFTPQGGIGLEINQLSAENNRAKIEIQISDTGIGIPKNNIDKIFERFYRVHPSYEGEYKGYGIGLYLVKKTVELLNGDIKVASEEGKGSCFTLSFNFSVANEDPDKNKAALQES
jgi:signal transduction histidine kinase